ncbi:MAG: serine--tRNA ligase, partial [Candidatus Thiodiazotropha taylori]|nr:serine--tRNA ligase [Candidatus Thiodiazotropha taylori]MCW4234409.1 serine--tRNA ligase [Candidatus Thiodiazotropha taylori]
MLDPRLIRNNLEEVAAQLRRRGYELDTQLIAQLEERRKGLQVESQELQNERNSRSKSIGKAKAAGEDIQPLLAEVAELGDRLKVLQEDLNSVQAELSEITLGIPNIPHESVPDG